MKSLWSHERPRARLGAPLAVGSIAIVRWLAPNRMVELLASLANYNRTLLEAGAPLPLPPLDVFLGFW